MTAKILARVHTGDGTEASVPARPALLASGRRVGNDISGRQLSSFVAGLVVRLGSTVTVSGPGSSRVRKGSVRQTVKADEVS